MVAGFSRVKLLSTMKYTIKFQTQKKSKVEYVGLAANQIFLFFLDPHRFCTFLIEIIEKMWILIGFGSFLLILS